jgi:hypothetical protein
MENEYMFTKWRLIVLALAALILGRCDASSAEEVDLDVLKNIRYEIRKNDSLTIVQKENMWKDVEGKVLTTKVYIQDARKSFVRGKISIDANTPEKEEQFGTDFSFDVPEDVGLQLQRNELVEIRGVVAPYQVQSPTTDIAELLRVSIRKITEYGPVSIKLDMYLEQIIQASVVEHEGVFKNLSKDKIKHFLEDVDKLIPEYIEKETNPEKKKEYGTIIRYCIYEGVVRIHPELEEYLPQRSTLRKEIVNNTERYTKAVEDMSILIINNVSDEYIIESWEQCINRFRSNCSPYMDILMQQNAGMEFAPLNDLMRNSLKTEGIPEELHDLFTVVLAEKCTSKGMAVNEHYIPTIAKTVQDKRRMLFVIQSYITKLGMEE